LATLQVAESMDPNVILVTGNGVDKLLGVPKGHDGEERNILKQRVHNHQQLF